MLRGQIHAVTDDDAHVKFSVRLVLHPALVLVPHVVRNRMEQAQLDHPMSIPLFDHTH